ncbi:sugar ABC transporter permease [Desulfonema ishimotonii]|uniref:Transport permease protein n=1 Tax=Desulfonema ishimotonii TaxID=45657 RepID=A0A401FUL3_9BACT|nr:ABC transporter permease [Desulfonema ishimotonii]GBC60662.1 sugar ABC transporter permease [Desulfonema ishimotonii]
MQLTRREVVSRYKGSFIGVGWSFIQPLLMLCVYTFVFSVVFKARWGVSSGESRATFALTMFMGIITFNIIAEVVNDAPSLILGNVNYVKKVVFPLEILPVVLFLNVLTNALFSLTVLVTGVLLFNHFLHWTILLLPVVWLPVSLCSMGCGYFLASFGVFVRDIKATVGIVTTMLFFMSPIFYPITAIPEQIRIFFQVNPIAIFVEDARRVVLWGQLPDWSWYFAGLGVSVAILLFGFIWFVKTKKAFADVI